MAWLCGVLAADLWQLPVRPLLGGGVGCALLTLPAYPVRRYGGSAL